ncbi:trace amine-associated receptor 13c-like [Megalops cyprinoides]|uniref:trace amine-associated receptor 13c-like n=1 Tax=Megalops cyprinoides TaxID=118141 RepID=UPI00186452BD|nr:trace amine-associated receptor 13c-like [Megalops cyprinoides]
MNLTEIKEEEFCAQSSNFSCFERLSVTAVDVLLYLSAAAAVLLTVFGNLLVIISICHFKQLHTPTNLLLLSLAVADFLVGVTVMPFQFIGLIESHWCFGTLYCIIFIAATLILTCVSIYNVACIAVDRYFALCNPFLYSTRITVNVASMIISCLWLFSVIYSMVLLYFNVNITDMTEIIECTGSCPVKINDMWAVVDLFLVFIVPCSTIIIMYMKVFAIAKRHANNIRCVQEQNNAKSTRKMHSVASERKAAKTLGILVSAFLLCIIPYYIVIFLYLHMKKPSTYLALMNMSCLAFLNSSINPIIYALFHSWFQRCVKLIVTLRICRSESSLMNVLSKDA